MTDLSLLTQPVARQLPVTMRAALSGPAADRRPRVGELPVPAPVSGQVLIRVRAVGLERADLNGDRRRATTAGPRVPGVEAVGVVVACPGRELRVGAQVAALLDDAQGGGCAEYLCVPVTQAISFFSELPWAVLGSIPRVVRTAYGSLAFGLDARAGQSVLIRGGSGAVGLAAVALARRQGLTVLATTRTPGDTLALRRAGAHHVLLDGGAVADTVRELIPGGVHSALLLNGTGTLRDTLCATRIHGVVCCVGGLSEPARVPGFDPADFLPPGVRLTGYRGRSSDLPPIVLQEFLDAVAAGDLAVPAERVFRLDEIGAAHRYLESGRITDRTVVLS
ncbi:zinc-binding dehydrogenase [Nocardia sp. NPDC059240]|uniref:zinc-binding dehydrogenase n=1 Tax=Nocardia sp. NPDC059240 TaxID=3346786 RepID=UPI003696AC7F